MKVDQKFLQQIFSDLPGGKAAINIIVAETINLGGPNDTKAIPHTTPRLQLPRFDLKALPRPEGDDEALFEILEKTPEPRMPTLMFLSFRVCVEKGMSRGEIAEFLGLTLGSVDSWARKYDLKPKRGK